MQRQYCVYVLTNKNRTVLNTGVAGDLPKRVRQHKDKLVASFTNRYDVDQLVYFEIFEDPTIAIEREKQIKAGSREKKVRLIEGMNPEWRDLSERL